MSTTTKFESPIPTTLAGMLSQANAIEYQLVESGGTITPEIEAMMLQNDKDLPAKVDSIQFVITRMASAAEMFKAEADRYAKVAKGLEAGQTRLKAYVKDGMIFRGITELEGQNNRFQLSNGRDRLVLDLEKLPEVYTTPTFGREPNKEAIEAALKRGEVIPGAHLEPTKTLRLYAAKKDLKK